MAARMVGPIAGGRVTLVYMMCVAILGLLCAIAAWFILRFWGGAVAAMLGFTLVLYGTCYCIVSIAMTAI